MTTGGQLERWDSNAPEALTTEADHLLTPGAAQLISEGLAANTREAYAYDWKAFTAWCSNAGRTPVPATPATLASYVTHMAELGRAPASIERALACILSAHDHAGKPKPATKAARLALRAYKRREAVRGRRTRKSPPITLERLREMVAATPRNIPGLRDRALLVLGFALMGRRSELAALNIADLTFTDRGIEVFIATSKTDKDSAGEIVSVPYGSNPETCPVRVVREWLDILAARGVTSGALLRPVDKAGRIGGIGRKGRGSGERITGHGINYAVRRAAIRAKLPNAERYTAHGLRAGGATSAAKSGKNLSTIARHGRWDEKSPTVAGYIRMEEQWTDNAMIGIGL